MMMVLFAQKYFKYFELPFCWRIFIQFSFSDFFCLPLVHHHPTSVSISLLHDAQIYHFKHTIILKFPCADIFFQFKCNFQVCVIFYLFIHFKNSSSALGHSAVECTVLEQLSFPLCIICDVMWWHSKWNKTWRHIGLYELVYTPPGSQIHIITK